MFLSLKLSPARLLAIVTAVVCAFLAADAWRTAKAEPPILLSGDFERAAYLKDLGLAVDPEPVWTKDITLTDQPDEALAAYISVLEEQGFHPLDYAGEKLTVYCYRAADNASTYARLLMQGNELVGADKSVAADGAPLSEPIAPDKAE